MFSCLFFFQSAPFVQANAALDGLDFDTRSQFYIANAPKASNLARQRVSSFSSKRRSLLVSARSTNHEEVMEVEELTSLKSNLKEIEDKHVRLFFYLRIFH